MIINIELNNNHKRRKKYLILDFNLHHKIIRNYTNSIYSKENISLLSYFLYRHII